MEGWTEREGKEKKEDEAGRQVLSYVPTVFENYTASFEIEKQRIELNMWDTSGSAYYDNVRPLAYPDSDAVLICFDISRPETLDSILKKWQSETQEFCPSAKVVVVGCKLDMRTDLSTLRELSKQRLIPITHEQVCAGQARGFRIVPFTSDVTGMALAPFPQGDLPALLFALQGSALARQIGAAAYAECSSKVSENSVRDVFHLTTLASVNKAQKSLKRSHSKRVPKRPPQTAGHVDLLEAGEMRKERARSCLLM
ncbi:RND2 protein, partial [Polypterus senegalus]